MCSSDLHRDSLCADLDAGMPGRLGHQGFHDGASRVIGAVKNAPARVAAFASEVELVGFVVLAGEVHSPSDEVVHPVRPLSHHETNGFFLGEAASSVEGVLDMGVDIVSPLHGSRDSALSPVGCTFQNICAFRDYQDASLRVSIGEFEREAQAVSAKANYLPQANVVIGGTYQTQNLQGIGLAFPGLSDRIGPYRTFNARPVVTQKVLDFSLLSAIRASRAETAAAKLDADQSREDAQAAVVALFLQTFQAQSRLTAARAILVQASIDTSRIIARGRVRAGA